MKRKTIRTRLDTLLLARGLAPNAQKAQAMILAGEVFVNGVRISTSGTPIAEDALVEINSREQRFASRGGLKLEGALRDFHINPAGKICMDVGSSTGGFTDCLLQQGATRVYAVDVTVDQIAWKLRQDARVVRVERNARELSSRDIPESVDLITVDVSFISAGKVLRPAASVTKEGASFLILVKPQFELGREEIGAGGIVADVALHEKAISMVKQAAASAGLECLGLQPSQLAGAEGNQEYFLHARKNSLG
ncbi:MAG TPA: TlyA family RNA methyltransferase [Candidatus Dormibacteraeota bacterium]|nr:TlyA family RNA methyltransferase [Candidatus Dormibacteraeota bacterium]